MLTKLKKIRKEYNSSKTFEGLYVYLVISLTNLKGGGINTFKSYFIYNPV